MKNDPIIGESLRRHHEATEPSLRNIFIIAASVALMIAISLMTTKKLVAHWSRLRPMQSMQALGIVTAPDHKPLNRFPVPDLELDDGHADQSALKAHQLEKLNGYGWADKSHGIARIPIERAIELIVARGLPQNTNATPEAAPLQLPQSANEVHP